MAKKPTWAEKMDRPNDLPKVVPLSGMLLDRHGPGTMAIPSPRMVEELIKTIPRGTVRTTNDLRLQVAERLGATIACQMTTGIFAWMVAHAADEAEREGQADIAPWWRVVKSDGTLNPKYPGGPEHQAARLKAEGISVQERGSKFRVLSDVTSGGLQ